MIYIDFDGVLGDLMPAWLNSYNSAFDDNLTPADITHWDITQFVKPECGADIFKFLHDEYLYDQVEPIEGAIEGLKTLKAEGVDWRILTTNTCVEMARGKIEFLRRHGLYGGQGWPSYLITAREKHLLRGEALVDDYTGNLNEFEGTRILFNSHHNQKACGSCYDQRVIDWPHLLIVLLSTFPRGGGE